MARKAAYEGGAWAVGGVRQQRPKVSPAVRRALLVDRYIPHCQRRIDQGAGKVYGPLLAEYRRELIAVSVELAKARRGAAVGVASATPETEKVAV